MHQRTASSPQTCPRWILAHHSSSTSVHIGIAAQLQPLVPPHTHAILMNYHSNQQGPLVATHQDIQQQPAGKVDTLHRAGPTITVIYVTPTQVHTRAQCGANHAQFLSDPQWPARHVFQA